MDPISAGLQVVGLGMSIFGGLNASADASRAADVQKSIAGDEQKINEQKNNAAQLQARRQSLEILRNNQRMRAQATNAAVNQGAQFGSGLMSGLGQVDSMSTFNLQGVAQNQEIGQNIFALNNSISGKKMELADIGASQAANQGLASLGGSLMKAGPTIGQLSQNFGSMIPSDPLGGFGGSSRWRIG